MPEAATIEKSSMDKDRILARKAGGGKAASSDHNTKTGEQEPELKHGFLRTVRGWADALFFAFLLAMFIRTYVFELFMIPTGSMTPALIGDDAGNITEMDWNGDKIPDIVALPHANFINYLQVHLRNEKGEFETELFLKNPNQAIIQKVTEKGRKGAGRRDMIMVNKFAYWFTPPKRGDIAIFKFPDRPKGSLGPPFEYRQDHRYLPSRPVYIKRCVGEPGEQVTFSPVEPYERHDVGDPQRLSPDEFGGVELVVKSKPILIDGKPLEDPLFSRLQHFPRPNMGPDGLPMGDPLELPRLKDDEVYMIGDNQMSSSDGRYWGPVPLNHMRGKAILRYLPIREFGILNDGI